MKYRIIFHALRLLMYVKRFFWWSASKINTAILICFGPIWRALMFLFYKLTYLNKKIGLNGETGNNLFKRDVLQLIIFVTMFILVVPQTKLYADTESLSVGQNTIAYLILGADEEFGSVEEVVADGTIQKNEVPIWKKGAISGRTNDHSTAPIAQDLGSFIAGGIAVAKPTLLPGATVAQTRTDIVSYEIQLGDYLGQIAAEFGVSVDTILWENNLGPRSIIRPGDTIKILPVSGVTHTVRKGDNISKIALLYQVKTEDIVKSNRIKKDGSDIKIGEKLIIPGGKKYFTSTVAKSTSGVNRYARAAAPPSSRQSPSLYGFVWPTAAHTITQYYNWRHHALDIAGPMSTAIYASKSGTVVTSQCGWNSGYGCYIIINHGGVRTLYGHNSRLLVSVGDVVETGQTIALMGNTGKVRGVTGIHLHFEIQVNGGRVNPLGYVR